VSSGFCHIKTVVHLAQFLLLLLISANRGMNTFKILAVRWALSEKLFCEISSSSVTVLINLKCNLQFLCAFLHAVMFDGPIFLQS
jgi:hypothetical protein